MTSEFVIFECINKTCLFRYPVRASSVYSHCCPRCRSHVRVVNEYSEPPIREEIKWNNQKTSISLVLDNIRSAYNVGSILRSADGFNLSHIYLCGLTATPENPKIAKTSLGAEWSIPWSYSSNGLITVQKLKEEHNYLFGLEVGPDCRPIFEIQNQISNNKIVLILGNELAGIDPEIRKICDQLFYIPMTGYKRSFNVTIAFGIAAFYLRYRPLL